MSGGSTSPLRLLVFTGLFPNRARPHHGVFVAERLRRYRAAHGVELRVVAPVPRRPPVGWKEWKGIPAEDHVGDIAVRHPRFLSPPGFGDRWRAGLLARAVGGVLADEVRRWQPDLVDVHYAFPEGVAAVRLRARLDRAANRRLPMVLTVRGSDLNLVPALPAVRGQVAGALVGVDHVVAVAEALRGVAVELGCPPERVTTLRNGVDTVRFTPGDRAAARRALKLPADGPVVLCVGHLIERKGQHLLVEAFARAFPTGGPRPRLVFVGDGERRGALQRQVRAAGLDDVTHFLGARHPESLPDCYRAADVSVLASSREGWPNVVLESLACGTPVIATRVWGTPEILEGCPAGRLVEVSGDGLTRALATWPELDAEAARPWAERHTWEATVAGTHALYSQLVGRP